MVILGPEISISLLSISSEVPSGAGNGPTSQTSSKKKWKTSFLKKDKKVELVIGLFSYHATSRITHQPHHLPHSPHLRIKKNRIKKNCLSSTQSSKTHFTVTPNRSITSTTRLLRNLVFSDGCFSFLLFFLHFFVVLHCFSFWRISVRPIPSVARDIHV